MKEQSPKYQQILSIALGLIIVVGVGVFAWQQWREEPAPVEPGGAYCTMEAKQCPDGSYVGRSGPNCEFAACPTASEPETGWKTLYDDKQKITYQYPPTLGTAYLHEEDWPPAVVIEDGIFSCASAPRTVQDRSYCFTQDSEGAAGSVYTTYTYTRNDETQSRMITVKFTIRFVQCANYDEPDKAACEKEREEFNVDGLADDISRSVQFIQ